MNEIKCNATNCGFNKSKLCQKTSVRVEGMFARSKLATFCESFRNPENHQEFAKEFDDLFKDEMLKDSNIICSANYCKYNDSNHCKKDSVIIGSEKAKYRSETECDSFEIE